MLGAIAGDIIGSRYEWKRKKRESFQPLFDNESVFTDDTVLTIAIADAILHCSNEGSFQESKKRYAEKLKAYGTAYPYAGFGAMFKKWLQQDSFEPYGSYGNGSAMRVSPIGFAFDDLHSVLEEAKKSAEVTHNHEEGIKGAQAIASAVFLARQNCSKYEIKTFVEDRCKYDLGQRLEQIRRHDSFDSTCQGTVPQAIIAFLESNHFEDAIEKALSLGGDSDTIACMAGGIAHAYYKKIPEFIIEEVKSRLDARLNRVLEAFGDQYSV